MPRLPPRLAGGHNRKRRVRLSNPPFLWCRFVAPGVQNERITQMPQGQVSAQKPQAMHFSSSEP
jgi:hypothetical protein